MNRKLRVGVIFGGKSGEHEVSLMSATSIIRAMDKEKYDIIPIGITKEGQWLLYKGDIDGIQSGQWEGIENKLLRDRQENVEKPLFKLIDISDRDNQLSTIDIIFPVLHGPKGEDGTIQGLLEMVDIPYVGAGVLPSALGMDKLYTKTIFKAFNLPQGEYLGVLRSDIEKNPDMIIEEVEKDFNYPVFIKPSNMGSSVGITKAKNREQLINGLKEASKYDRKILIEKSINCREIECAVLGNDNPIASIPGEIIPSKEFYDYEAKYFDGDNSTLLIPAPLTEDQIKEVQDLAVCAYKAIDCNGMARVDFFLEKDTQKIYINEINTIPGFTRISMYPKLWEASGIPYSKLIDMLIEIGIERYEDKKGIHI